MPEATHAYRGLVIDDNPAIHEDIRKILRPPSGGDTEVSDRLGHAGGDPLLREVADRLLESARDADTIARVGGDEFAILLEVDRGHNAPLAAERILEACSQRVAPPRPW